jgi:glycosyltransferase involved in cell wall biosynthesis
VRTLGKALGRLPRWIYRPIGNLLNRMGNPTYAGRVLMYPYLVEQTIAGRQTALRNAELIVAPSQAIAEVLARNGVEPGRIQVIPHGIEPLPRTPLSPFEDRPVRFGYVGQITRAKGLHVLFEAFASLPEGLAAELHVIGGAQHPWEEKYLAQSIACCGNSGRVILHGHVPHAELAAAMAQIDVLVLPAIYLEVFGLVVLEAFSAGRPVIASRCGGPEELIRHGIDGLLFPRNSASALADIMKDVIRQPERIAAMAANIQPVRTLAEHVSDLEAAYGRVMLGVGGRPRSPSASLPTS